MKKCILLVSMIVSAIAFTGCNSSIGVREGFGYTAPGIIYSQGANGGVAEPNFEILKRPYKHISRVSGESSQTNVLLVLTTGDASIEAAQKNALGKAKNADALINRNFDVKHFSVLGVFTIATLQVTGDAIQFTDNR